MVKSLMEEKREKKKSHLSITKPVNNAHSDWEGGRKISLNAFEVFKSQEPNLVNKPA